MRAEWNERARTNARWFIASDVGSEAEFVHSGARDTAFALRGLEPAWVAGAKALEIGCGAGRMTAFLATRIDHVVAVDVSTEMIDLARARLEAVTNVELHATNGEDLAVFAADTFDFVLSYIVFQHVPKSIVQTYFQEIRRVLRPGGVFRGQLARITDPAYRPPGNEDTFTMRSWSQEEVDGLLADWSKAELDVLRITPSTEHIWVTAEP